MKTQSKKTKLTLTVRKSAIDAAKKYSRRTGKSVSALFEDIFENAEVSPLKSESQKAAERLLKRLGSEKSVATKNESDKSLIAKHVARKFA